MIEITSFLLKHLYELMADNYQADRGPERQHQRQQQQQYQWQANQTNEDERSRAGRQQQQQQPEQARLNQHHQPIRSSCQLSAQSGAQTTTSSSSSLMSAATSREQEANQQIVSFVANNQLPDLACETFIELLFICVFLAVSWIFVMIVQLHCHQVQQPAKYFYCNTKLLASLMYCNHHEFKSLAY